MWQDALIGVETGSWEEGALCETQASLQPYLEGGEVRCLEVLQSFTEGDELPRLLGVGLAPCGKGKHRICYGSYSISNLHPGSPGCHLQARCWFAAEGQTPSATTSPLPRSRHPLPGWLFLDWAAEALAGPSL